MSPDGTTGWLAHHPASYVDSSSSEDPIEVVELRPLKESGPFWEPDQFISADFNELYEWLGISRSTFDAAVEWSERWDSHSREDSPLLESERHALIDRLRTEVHGGISFK